MSIGKHPGGAASFGTVVSSCALLWWSVCIILYWRPWIDTVHMKPGSSRPGLCRTAWTRQSTSAEKRQKIVNLYALISQCSKVSNTAWKYINSNKFGVILKSCCFIHNLVTFKMKIQGHFFKSTSGEVPNKAELELLWHPERGTPEAAVILPSSCTWKSCFSYCINERL